MGVCSVACRPAPVWARPRAPRHGKRFDTATPTERRGTGWRRTTKGQSKELEMLSVDEGRHFGRRESCSQAFEENLGADRNILCRDCGGSHGSPARVTVTVCQ